MTEVTVGTAIQSPTVPFGRSTFSHPATRSSIHSLRSLITSREADGDRRLGRRTEPRTRRGEDMRPNQGSRKEGYPLVSSLLPWFLASCHRSSSYSLVPCLSDNLPCPTVWALRSSCRYDPFPVGDECNEMESGEGDDKRIEPRSTGNAERQRLDQ